MITPKMNHNYLETISPSKAKGAEIRRVTQIRFPGAKICLIKADTKRNPELTRISHCVRRLETFRTKSQISNF